MNGRTIARLGAIASERWGMLTAAQAAEADISRKVLSRLAASGAIERLAQGVYRMAGAPAAAQEVDAIRVHWLALGGATGALVVAGGKTAATLHRLGDWFPGESDFVTPVRRTTRLSDVRLRVRRLDEEDVVYVDGLPAMTVERTIADVVEAREDSSLVADALWQAVQRGTLLRPRRLAQLLEPLAHRNGETSGAALAERLMLAGGVEESWIDRLH
ncbi:type IV toxin-antitoxin system AbiEi family antitoxin domain-containing protein [Microbacterium sp. M28]|uniref:type IV toxin-antitoxin system AbiEi family antitoxin domain-containing protein n=1 Tax=Microbacterium sp. M28 TaxID=2962064 RepID=UPI0021F4A28A|nr:type IV toxin-antitoxin system AbiEi family antitoxin domain-containing protein [Microbacterium sp. M28]UYO96386.1 type IV toxin-antitoxin system AbiEi family antitoxin domain-containing protein [Microbacterium sp. M28]